MSTPSENAGTVTGTVELDVGAYHLQARLTLPAQPTSLRVLLPVIQNFSNVLVDLAVKSVEDQGKTISCQAGCGACCRQLVPIAETEAYSIAALVEEMPEPRRAQIRQRFADAWLRLAETGMLDLLERREKWTEAEYQKVRNEYFYLKIPCPFLEDESCSIHPHRPVTCREYLVTSPPQNCAKPTADSIDLVPLAAKVWTALARLDKPAAGARYIRWVPLVTAPDWAAEHPETPRVRPGPEWLSELFTNLAGKEIIAESPPIG